MHLVSSGFHRSTLPVDAKYIETNTSIIFNRNSILPAYDLS